jgi:hypothetical protein
VSPEADTQVRVSKGSHISVFQKRRKLRSLIFLKRKFEVIYNGKISFFGPTESVYGKLDARKNCQVPDEMRTSRGYGDG